MSKNAATLRRENRALEKRIIELKNSAKGRSLNNTLESLVANTSAFSQDNLTSIVPLITANIYSPLSINWNVLMYMYKTHGIIQTAIDEPVEDAFRDGLDLSSGELDAKDLGELEDFMEDTGVIETVKNVLIWGRLFGGAALVVNAESYYGSPLDLKSLKGGRLEFYDATRWELGCKWRYDDKYTLYGKTLDASRVLTVGNKRAPWVIRQQLSGWDLSAIESMVEDFNLYLRTRNVLYSILDEAKLDIYMLDGLREALATPDGTDKVQQRVQLMNQLKNFQNALVMDKNDLYEQKQLTFSGIAEIMKQNQFGIASALRMPVSKIFGIGASGFSSGEDDIENYNAMVQSKVRQPARPLVRKVLKMCCMAVYGREYDIDFAFKPLRTMSAKEEEEVKTSKQNRFQAFYDRGLMNSAEMGELMHKEKLVNIETQAQLGKLDEFPAPAGMAGAYDEEAGDEPGSKDQGDQNGK